MLTEIQLFECTNTKHIWMLTKKGQVITFNLILTLIWFFNGNFDTWKWKVCYTSQYVFANPHRQTQSTSQLSCEDRVSLVWVDLHVSFCRQQYRKRAPAVRLVYPPFFYKLRFSSSSVSGDLNSSISVTIWNCNHVHTDIFSHNDRYYHLPKYWSFPLNHPV